MARPTQPPPAVPDDSTLEPTLDFMRLLWRIEHSLQSRSKQMKATIGVTGPQRLVLRIVDQYPGVGAGELARLIRLHPSTITGIVQRLVEQGLLARAGDRSDRRRVQLQLRHGAKQYTARSEGTIEHAISRVLSRMPDAHVRHTRAVLGAIATALEAH